MNIYVGTLPNSVNENDLRELFQAFGQVSTAAVIKDKFSGESRGFGFVEMPNREEAEKAIAALGVLPESDYKNALADLARFSVDRNY